MPSQKFYSHPHRFHHPSASPLSQQPAALKACPSVETQGFSWAWKVACICVLATLLVVFTALLIAFLVWALSHPADTYAKHQPENDETPDLKEPRPAEPNYPRDVPQTKTNSPKGEKSGSKNTKDYYDYDQ